MEFRNLKSFVRVAELRSFSRAAEQLGYVQSTVTMQIRQLEAELGCPLFERGKEVRLSAKGEELLHYAYALIRCEKEAKEHLMGDERPSGTLRVGMLESISASVGRRIIKTYLCQCPRVSLIVKVATTLELIALLEQGQVDLILTLDKRIQQEPLLSVYEKEEPIPFFCGANHPLASKDHVYLKDIVNEPFLLTEKGCNYRQVFEEILAERRRKVFYTLDIGCTELIIECVRENMGIALLPVFTLERAVAEGGLALLHVDDCEIKLFAQLLYRENKWLSLAMRAFIEIVETVWGGGFKK